MKQITLLIIFLFSYCAYGQSDFCNKNYGDSYFPLEIGFKKHITWGGSIYVEEIKEKVNIEGKDYYKYLQDFGNGTVYDLLLRNQNDTIYMYFEEQKKENIFLIAKPEVGAKWSSGKITDINGSFETPYCNYENLMVVDYKYSNGTKEQRYYKKGLGLVAITSKKEIKGMCMPSKEESEALVEPLSFIGCENKADKTEITKCTMAAIHSYVVEKLKTEDIKLPKEDGILKYKVSISKDGEVSNVETLNSISGGKQVRKTIKKIIESLPRFIPAKTAERKAVGTKIELSIPIKI